MDILQTLKELNGYWQYDGGKYLAKLTSGKVSDVFCNTGVLTCNPCELTQAVQCLLYNLFKIEPNYRFTIVQSMSTPVYICGPAMGGITLAYEVARQLSGTAIFTEPVYEGVMSNTGMLGIPIIKKVGQELKRFSVHEGATVLFVEDVITTGKSTEEMIEAVWTNGVHGHCGPSFMPLPYVLCLVNRSGKDSLFCCGPRGDTWASEGMKFKIISLADVEARTWDTVEDAREELEKWDCNLMGGPPDPTDPNSSGFLKEYQENVRNIEAVRPKDNWDLLTKGV